MITLCEVEGGFWVARLTEGAIGGLVGAFLGETIRWILHRVNSRRRCRRILAEVHALMTIMANDQHIDVVMSQDDVVVQILKTVRGVSPSNDLDDSLLLMSELALLKLHLIIAQLRMPERPDRNTVLLEVRRSAEKLRDAIAGAAHR